MVTNSRYTMVKIVICSGNHELMAIHNGDMKNNINSRYTISNGLQSLIGIIVIVRTKHFFMVICNYGLLNVLN